MPKSVNLIDESIKTGGAVAFLQLERFNAGKLLREKLAGANGNASTVTAPGGLPTSEQIAQIKESNNLLPQYMVAMFEINKVVYCRHGRDYIPLVARQITLALRDPTLNQPVRQIATYLINIKKLV